MDRVIDFIFTAVLILTAVKDFKTKIIPDYFNGIIFILSIVKIIFLNGDFEKSLIGMGVFPIIFIIIYGYISEIFKRELVGFGDIKLMGMAGFYIGYSGIYNLIVLYNIIFTLGFLSVVPFIFIKKIGRKAEIPFAPFICIGILIFKFIEVKL